MKILMFNNEFPPLGGGTGTVNYQLFSQLKDHKNLSIDLISSAAGKQKQTELFAENIRIIKLPVRKNSIHHATNTELIRYGIKSSFAALRLLKKQEYDFVFVWTTVPSGLPALFLKLFKNIPYIVRIGGPDIPGFEKRYTYIYKIISPFIKTVWKKARKVIVKCQTEYEMVKKLNSKLPLQVIHNGIDTEIFKPTTDKQTSENLKIICSGRLIKRKGQYTLLTALHKLKQEGIKNLQTEFIGEGDEKSKYEKYAVRKNIREQVHFSGFVPPEKMPEKYQTADLFVLPSHNEGMSNALLEAMASGLPVLVSDVGGTRELVDEKNGYIFNAGDPEQLAYYLKRIIKNKKNLKGMGQNSREKAKQFNWQNITGEYLKLFEEIASRNPNKR